MVYNINEHPQKWYEWIIYTLQMILAVFVATVLIANICGTPISSCLLGAGIGTIIYELITGFKSPMFISSCGATVSAVCGALALSESGNYLMVACGGAVILAIYAIFALVVKVAGIDKFNAIFPPSIVGAITIVIGINLAGFIFGYVSGSYNVKAVLTGTAIINEELYYTFTNYSNTIVPWLQVLVAIVTMLITAIVSQYGKGFMKNIPFLFGIIGGYIVALCFGLVDFSAFDSMTWYPELTFLKWSASDWSWANFGSTVLFFLPVGLCALLEHYSDHKVLSGIIGTDLTVKPGLTRTLVGDGVASAVGTMLCGLPNTSYGESTATIGFSKVASVWVTFAAACTMVAMSFFGPISAFVQTIPACVFGGCAMILYGYIAASGLKTLSKVDLNNNKNLIVVSVILTVGVSGIYLFNAAFTGVALAMVLGIILNLILREKESN